MCFLIDWRRRDVIDIDSGAAGVYSTARFPSIYIFIAGPLATNHMLDLGARHSHMIPHGWQIYEGGQAALAFKLCVHVPQIMHGMVSIYTFTRSFRGIGGLSNGHYCLGGLQWTSGKRHAKHPAITYLYIHKLSASSKKICCHQQQLKIGMFRFIVIVYKACTVLSWQQRRYLPFLAIIYKIFTCTCSMRIASFCPCELI